MDVRKKFDLVNFFYGLGAAVIFVAALFKFLGWKFADTLFMIGLLGEAFIFLVSAFEWKIIKPTYHWERLFPQLKDRGNDISNQDLGLEEMEEAAAVTKELQLQKMLDSILSLDENIQNLNQATQRLNQTVENLEKSYEGMSKSTLEYQQEINSMKIKIASANDRLKEFESYKF